METGVCQRSFPSNVIFFRNKIEQFTRYSQAILAHRRESKTASDQLAVTTRPFAYPSQQTLQELLNKKPTAK
jgi:hypothetical protein